VQPNSASSPRRTSRRGGAALAPRMVEPQPPGAHDDQEAARWAQAVAQFDMDLVRAAVAQSRD
jgi:hypothetical protein